jgi:SAM-dependent methyltransferase
MTAGDRQKEHYESIHDAYEDHYYDATSMAYRERFYYDPLFAGLELNDRDVAELASGSGHNSRVALQRFPRTRVTGFDVSSAACEAYRRRVGRPCHELDLTQPLVNSGSFDVVMMIGGLHHCVADVPTALDNVARMVRPGGFFVLLEPNRRFALERLRRFWYRVDRYFDAATEAALDHDEVLALTRGKFALLDCRYMGGPGYFLIAQSLLFRLPKRLKAALGPALMASDALYNRLPFRLAFPYFVARWRRLS